MNHDLLRQRCSRHLRIGQEDFGAGQVGWIAGPCAVESYEQMRAAAEFVRSCGITVMRGGLFKPRTSPHSFQGLQAAGIDIVRRIKEEFGLAYVAEAVDATSLELLLPHLDAVQIGSRNCMNYALLKLVGQVGKPVILKRGFAMTIDEWLSAAEYLALAGTRDILLCERGIRSVTEVTRFTLDLCGLAWLKNQDILPIIADPSHACGDSALVPPLAQAALAAGADGLLLEVSPCPEEARCDGKQQLSFAQLKDLRQRAKKSSDR
jgi:3-deoxy-7-phosphoheptulonate synthase